MKRSEKYKIEWDTLVIPGLQGQYRILQISDSHICFESELDDEASREKGRKMAAIWTSVGNGLSQRENFDNLVDYGHEIGCDCFVFSGDMVDFASRGNVHEVFRIYETVGDYFVIPGNHDTGHYFYRHFLKTTNQSPDIQVKELGELLLVGIDNGKQSISDHMLKELEILLSGDRPVLLVHHVPLDNETLHVDAARLLKDSLPYYLLGMRGEGVNIEAYYDLLSKRHTSLKAILAGHLHFSHRDLLPNGVPQYVTGACLNGCARILCIQGEAQV
ncbi:MAG: hypothetical protein E7618_08215 [Ruminococcaceae bacterium]|nr:hypothetical protein [Oscillospiraceae bacterium]